MRKREEKMNLNSHKLNNGLTNSSVNNFQQRKIILNKKREM